MLQCSAREGVRPGSALPGSPHLTNDVLLDARAALDAGDLEAAFTILNSAISQDSASNPDALSLLARAFMLAGMRLEAAETLERAATLETPEATAFMLNSMQLYYEVGNREKAFLLALQLNKVLPEHQDVIFVLVEGFQERNETDLVDAFKFKLINSSNPDHLALASRLIGAEGYSENHLTLYKKLYSLAPDQGPIVFSLMDFAAVFHDFDTLSAIVARLKGEFAAGNREIFKGDFPRNSLIWSDNEAINRLAENANDMPAKPEGLNTIRHAQSHGWSDKIRVGYVSNEFWDDHATMRLFQSVLTAHDSDRFEVTLFCYTPEEMLKFDTGARGKWGTIVPIGSMSDEEVAAEVSRRGIDILVDLKGYTGGSRPGIFNQLAAPVQVSWLGFPGTLINVDLDYIIGDHFVLPDSSKPFYSEKFCRLPESYQPNDPVHRALPEALSRRDLALPEGKFIFAAFTAANKIMPETIGLWLQILKKVPDSVLWMMETNEVARQNLARYALLQGVMPNRLIFAPKMAYAEHVARIQASDLVLDTFPYNGHTTSSDALWAGVPVATKKGHHFASRVSESLLNAIGLGELVAADNAAFVDLAVNLANDRNRLAGIREKLVANRFRSPLFDAERFCRHLEAAYETMAERAKSGLEPDHFDVPALPPRSAPFMQA
jgi:predicted O-linked N-acetylglucosamine transferase (SPINDLY family)